MQATHKQHGDATWHSNLYDAPTDYALLLYRKHKKKKCVQTIKKHNIKKSNTVKRSTSIEMTTNNATLLNDTISSINT
jgi:hypothetical protein